MSWLILGGEPLEKVHVESDEISLHLRLLRSTIDLCHFPKNECSVFACTTFEVFILHTFPFSFEFFFALPFPLSGGRSGAGMSFGIGANGSLPASSTGTGIVLVRIFDRRFIEPQERLKIEMVGHGGRSGDGG